MPALNFAQQDDLFDPKMSRPVTLIGAGSVGGHVAMMLASIGVTDLTVYDGDYLESHNMPVSLVYQPDDLGMFKVKSLAKRIHSSTGVVIKEIPRMYVGEALRSTVVACVDTMEARQCIWQNVKGNPLVDLLIDTRMAKEFISNFAIQPCKPDDVSYYDYFTSYPSSEAVRPLCGRHGIVYVTATAAAAAVTNLTNFWKSGKYKRHFKFLCGELESIE